MQEFIDRVAEIIILRIARAESHRVCVIEIRRCRKSQVRPEVRRYREDKEKDSKVRRSERSRHVECGRVQSKHGEIAKTYMCI